MCSFLFKNEERAKKDKEKAAKAAKDRIAEEDSWRIGSISLDEVRLSKNIPNCLRYSAVMDSLIYLLTILLNNSITHPLKHTLPLPLPLPLPLLISNHGTLLFVFRCVLGSKRGLVSTLTKWQRRTEEKGLKNSLCSFFCRSPFHTFDPIKMIYFIIMVNFNNRNHRRYH